MQTLFRTFLIILEICCVIAAILAWVIPVEVVQNWMVERAADNDYARYAAQEQAEALSVSLSILLPILCILIGWSVYRFGDVSRTVSDTLKSIWSVTENKASWRSWLLRSFLLVWFLLAGFHYCNSYWLRIQDWPWYHFYDGPDIMPNISDSNRDVIRFLEQKTPKDSKILILSDQKLFFLSYYLLPRELYHPIHPDSEFVIPKANQERQLIAYQRSELDDAYLEKISPDYILEYFEGSKYVESDRVLEDKDWIGFLRSQKGPEFTPNYNVRLSVFSSKKPGGEK